MENRDLQSESRRALIVVTFPILFILIMLGMSANCKKNNNHNSDKAEILETYSTKGNNNGFRQN